MLLKQRSKNPKRRFMLKLDIFKNRRRRKNVNGNFSNVLNKKYYV